MQSVQRIGQDLSETVLKFASEAHTLSLGPRKTEADVLFMESGILDYLQGADGAKTEPEIGEAVEGKTSIKRKALRLLVEARKVDREGAGKRGDPFRYRFSFSCSPDIPGTREQESSSKGESATNQQDGEGKARCGDAETSFHVPDASDHPREDVLEV